jgi:hypothetical protein
MDWMQTSYGGARDVARQERAFAVSAAMWVSFICNLFSSNICGLEVASDSSPPVVLQFREHLKNSHSSVHPVSLRPQ